MSRLISTTPVAKNRLMPETQVESTAEESRDCHGVDKGPHIHDSSFMKTITINVSEPVYRDFQRIAKAQDRTASELIRQAMEEFRERRIVRSTTLADLSPVSVGRVLAPLRRGDDLLAELLDDDRD